MQILTIATLFPNSQQPGFGKFAGYQAVNFNNVDGVKNIIFNPLPHLPFPFSHLPQYRKYADLPRSEQWQGLDVYRPHFFSIPIIGAASNARNIAKAILPIARNIHKKTPFDIVHGDFFHPDAMAALLVAKELGVAFTAKARGSDINYWAQTKATKNQILMAAEQAAGILCVSKGLSETMQSLGMDGQKITVHYTGCDQEKFKPSDNMDEKYRLKASLDMKDDEELLLSIGNLIPLKRHELAIKSLQHLPHCHLAIAGNGVHKGKLEVLVMQLSLGNRVHFLGNVPHNDIPKWINAATAMILVSQSEGLANVWVESLACGTPIIISDTGGAKELVGDDHIVQLVDADSEQIAHAVNTIIAQPIDKAAARERVSQFTWQKNAQNLYDFYNRIICA